MKGTTIMKVSHATIVEAMQEYLDNRFTDPMPALTVTAVDKPSQYEPEFTVTLQEKMPLEPKETA